MHPTLRLVLFVVVGFVGGSVANMLVLKLGNQVIPPPAGADVSTPEGLNASMAVMTPIDFLVPFLSHAVGALVGGYIATRWGNPTSWVPAGIVGALFLLGGATMVVMVPNTPTWFAGLDLVVAYLPMGYLGYLLARSK